jgi:adenosylmethionine-8-amino-7-oxononanoate aminotransferase
VFRDADRARTFFHGHSYAGNPLGCAVALESLRIFDEEPVLQRANRIGERIRARIEPLRGRVKDVRGIGSVQVVELEGRGYLDPVGPRMAAAALARDVLLRPLGSVLYALPPLCLTDEEADHLGRTMRDVAEEALAP